MIKEYILWVPTSSMSVVQKIFDRKSNVNPACGLNGFRYCEGEVEKMMNVVKEVLKLNIYIQITPLT